MSTTKNLSHILDEEDDLIPKSARRVAAVPVGASVEEKSAAARAVGELHSFDLSKYGISRPKHVFRNPSVAAMYEIALRKEAGTRIASSGALIAYSGEKTGRSPKDKRIVDTPAEHDDVFWESSACIPLSEHSFAVNKERAIDYLNCCCDHVFVIDAFAGWEADTRIKVRVISALAYHALFMHTMLVRPTEQELAEFGEPDVVIFNAGAFPANRLTDGMTSKTSIDLNLKTMEVVVLNSKYAGENKKSILSVMMYVALKRGHLPLHSSANMGRAEGDVTLFFGLSGTGKTTLSADPRRRLIGDDEHVWAERGVYNIEGGCYAKCDHLTREQEPEIYDAIRFGSVLENVVYDPITHVVDFDDLSVTENTRVAYPINYIPDAVIPCVGPHPRNIILLTCDAFGVLPPVSLLTPEQVQYQFISGYTAKVAGTEVGVTEPTATFSACFGEAFLVCHPGRYARVLAEKMQRHGGRAWLVNTGWSGGAYGVGQRMKLRLTRAIIDAIHDGTLAEAEMQTMPVFGLRVPTKCAGVPDEVLLPRNAWADKEAYDRTLLKVGALFIRNFEKYARGVAPEILAAGPQVDAATVAQLVPASKGKEAVAG